MSERDIHTGKRWRAEIASQLSTAKIGILCLTRENLDRPWINFEAGALSRAVGDDSRVCPYCFGLKPTDYGDPLGDFNGVEATKRGTLDLLRSINAAMDQPLRSVDLEAVFARMWSDLEEDLRQIPAEPHPTEPVREQEEILEELVSRVRGLEQSLSRSEKTKPAPLEGMFRSMTDADMEKLSQMAAKARRDAAVQVANLVRSRLDGENVATTVNGNEDAKS
jgi:hypothetical protein